MRNAYMVNLNNKRWSDQLQHYWHQPLAIPCLVLLTLGLCYLASQLNFSADFTQNQRNTLSLKSIQLLQQMPAPIQVQAYCSNSPYKGRYFRKSIQALLQRYQRHHAALTLTFIDPVTESTLARSLNMKKEGELRVSYQGQQASMYLPYSEEAFSNLLLGLKHGQAAPLIFVEGLGAPDLDDARPTGGRQLKQALHDAGIPLLQAQPLANESYPAKHTLVLAGADQAYPSHFVERIREHVSQGGNLVWLVDQPERNGLQALAEQIGVETSTGMAIDPGNRAFDIAPHELATQHYAAQGATEDFALRTFFSHAHAVMATRQSQPYWKVTPLIAVADQGWVSHDYQPSQRTMPTYNPAIDQPGPVTIALSLQHTQQDGSSQRVLIIGSTRFFQNAQLARGGNQAMAVKLLQWVRNNQPTIKLSPAPLRDSIVLLPTSTQQHMLLLGLFNGFQFGLPLLLGIFAWQRYRRKRKT